MARRHRAQRIKPSLNVYRESRSTDEIKRELEAAGELLKEQRLLRKTRVKTTNPDNCLVPEAGLVTGGWRYEAKLLKAAAKRLEL